MVPTDFTGKIHLPRPFEHFFSPLGSDFIPTNLFRADQIMAGNTFSDITAAIYEIDKILNPPGLCIFVRETQWWYLFCSIYKNEDARVDFIRNLAQKVKKMMFLGPL